MLTAQFNSYFPHSVVRWVYHSFLLHIPSSHSYPLIFLPPHCPFLSILLPRCCDFGSLLVSASSFGQASLLSSYDNADQTLHAPRFLSTYMYLHLPAKHTHTRMCTYSICISFKVTRAIPFKKFVLPCPLHPYYM